MPTLEWKSQFHEEHLHVEEAVLAGVGTEARDVVVEAGREVYALGTRAAEHGAAAAEVRVGADEAEEMDVSTRNDYCGCCCTHTLP